MTDHGDWGLLLGLVDWRAEREVLVTEANEKFLAMALELITRMGDAKFRKGNAENGDDFMGKSLEDLLLDNLHEHIDGAMYCIRALQLSRERT